MGDGETERSARRLAIEIDASGYNQNCARCHGLESVSGGIAPDLRLLEEDYDGDEWYRERVRNISAAAPKQRL